MTGRTASPSLARRKSPAAKLKSERIQGAAEKAPVAIPPHGGPGLERVERAEITRLLAQMPGWRFDPERSSFHVRIPRGAAPVEIPVGGGLTVATGLVAWVDVRLSGSARQWTKTRLEGVRAVNRLLPPAGGLAAEAQEASPRTRRAR